MKKILFYLPVLALLIAGASAFATRPSHAFAKKWFVYSGSGGPGTNSNYSLAPGGGADPMCPVHPSTVCAVQADPSSGNANIPDQTELNGISTASSSFTTAADGLEYRTN